MTAAGRSRQIDRDEAAGKNVARDKSTRGALAHLAQPGAELTVRVTPGAARTAVEDDGEELRVRVTVPPEGGKANAAVRAALADALGIAKGRLALIRGRTSRVKVWRVD